MLTAYLSDLAAPSCFLTLLYSITSCFTKLAFFFYGAPCALEKRNAAHYGERENEKGCWTDPTFPLVLLSSSNKMLLKLHAAVWALLCCIIWRPEHTGLRLFSLSLSLSLSHTDTHTHTDEIKLVQFFLQEF